MEEGNGTGWQDERPPPFLFLRWREGDQAAEMKLQQKICSLSSLKNQRAEFGVTTALESEVVILES